MTQRKKRTTDKRWQANGDCGQNKRKSFFSLHHFANGPTFKNKPCRLTARVTRLGWERGFAVETEKTQSKENT
jgi:hypothetical protein